jgi:hypothetical protein
MRNGSKRIKFPSSLRMGTFRKFLFAPYPRRPGGRLWVNHEKMGIIDQEILSYSPTVKEKMAFGNGLRFQAQIECKGGRP